MTLAVILVIAFVAILGIIWKFFHKSKIAVFGGLFFLVNIALVLQFLQVGGAVVADRYSYVSYFGLFFIIGYEVSVQLKKHPDSIVSKAIIGVMAACILSLSILSYQRCEVWRDGVSLWQNEHEQYPDEVVGCQNLGSEYFDRFIQATATEDKMRYADSAYSLLSLATASDTSNQKDFLLLGDISRSEGKNQKAREYYSKIFALGSDFASAANYGLGQICWTDKKTDSAGYYYRLALKLTNHFPEVHNDYANYLDATGLTDSALSEYAIAISQKPDWYAPYLNRGKALQRKDKEYLAFPDFNKAVALAPQVAETYYFRAYCFANKENNTAAFKDLEKAVELGYKQIDTAFYRQMSVKKGGLSFGAEQEKKDH